MKTNDELKNRIKAAISGIEGLTAYLPEIHTQVSNGKVTLSGHVDTLEHKEGITDVIMLVEGVQELSNQLQILPPDKHRLDVNINWSKGDMTLN